MPRIWLIIPYFGKLPELLPLWLASCGKNPSINWLVLSDTCSPRSLPANVLWQKATLDETVAAIFAAVGAVHQTKVTPYKLCDFRPAFWTLLDRFELQYDFWGHCDLDMVFGDILSFVPENILDNYHKIFTFGHLTIYKNSDLAKNAFRRETKDFNWLEIFQDTACRGFDEHFGVNRIWKQEKLPQYENELIIADIDPQFRNLYLTNRFMNRFCQAFIYKNCRILQLSKSFIRGGGEIYEREFAYIHLQKRHIQGIDNVCTTNGYVFLHNGVATLPAEEWQVSALNNSKRTLSDVRPSELARHVKANLRYIKQGFHTSY